MLGLPYGKVFLVPWTEEWEISLFVLSNFYYTAGGKK